MGDADQPSDVKQERRGEKSDYKSGDNKSEHKIVHKSEHRSEHRSEVRESEPKREPKANDRCSSEGSVKSSSKRKIWERVIKEDNKEEPSFLQKCIRNKFIVAAVVGVLTAVLLVALNPPMIQEKPTDSVSVPGRSVKKVLAWSALAAGLSLLIPVCLKKYSASKQV